MWRQGLRSLDSDAQSSSLTLSLFIQNLPNLDHPGVYVGSMYHEYAGVAARVGAAPSPLAVTGGGPSFLAGRASFAHGLGGPCLSLDTACSSSLMALALAADALRLGQASAALAAGVNALLDGATTAAICLLGALSPVGRCRAFDAAADGYGRGDGFVTLGLGPLVTRDEHGTLLPPPLARMAGWAANQAGSRAALAAPSGPAQTRVVRDALRAGGLDPGAVAALSLHGTGTLLGDPLEVGAAGAALGAPRSSPPALLAGKATHAHTEGAAGLTATLCALCTLQDRSLAPVLHLRTLNPHVAGALGDWGRGPGGKAAAALPRQYAGLPGNGRGLAGASSFGMSGVNTHVVLAPVDRLALGSAEGSAWEVGGDAVWKTRGRYQGGDPNEQGRREHSGVLCKRLVADAGPSLAPETEAPNDKPSPFPAEASAAALAEEQALPAARHPPRPLPFTE